MTIYNQGHTIETKFTSLNQSKLIILHDLITKKKIYHVFCWLVLINIRVNIDIWALQHTSTIQHQECQGKRLQIQGQPFLHSKILSLVGNYEKLFPRRLRYGRYLYKICIWYKLLLEECSLFACLQRDLIISLPFSEQIKSLYFPQAKESF